MHYGMVRWHGTVLQIQYGTIHFWYCKKLTVMNKKDVKPMRSAKETDDGSHRDNDFRT